jgi:hypothetical protein
MTHRPAIHRNDSNAERLRRAFDAFLAELRVLPPEPALIPIPVVKPGTRQRR